MRLRSETQLRKASDALCNLKCSTVKTMAYLSAVASLLLKRNHFPYAARCEKANVKILKLF